MDLVKRLDMNFSNCTFLSFSFNTWASSFWLLDILSSMDACYMILGENVCSWSVWVSASHLLTSLVWACYCFNFFTYCSNANFSLVWASMICRQYNSYSYWWELLMNEYLERLQERSYVILTISCTFWMLWTNSRLSANEILYKLILQLEQPLLLHLHLLS